MNQRDEYLRKVKQEEAEAKQKEEKEAQDSEAARIEAERIQLNSKELGVNINVFSQFVKDAEFLKKALQNSKYDTSEFEAIKKRYKNSPKYYPIPRGETPLDDFKNQMENLITQVEHRPKSGGLLSKFSITSKTTSAELKLSDKVDPDKFISSLVEMRDQYAVLGREIKEGPYSFHNIHEFAKAQYENFDASKSRGLGRKDQKGTDQDRLGKIDNLVKQADLLQKNGTADEFEKLQKMVHQYVQEYRHPSSRYGSGERKDTSLPLMPLDEFIKTGQNSKHIFAYTLYNLSEKFKLGVIEQLQREEAGPRTAHR